MQEIVISLVAAVACNSGKVATRISTEYLESKRRVEATNDIWVRAKRPRTCHNT
jgi:hypothetical protein